ncbi:MAG: TIGR01212 family radical SAM protein [Lachnospiraceae bacterium]|nr:TIGR01212 family radical SAM protein [Lachnospiraceae bacterium]
MYYNSLNNYLKNRFGTKVYKLSLNAGLTCPNRDGTLSYDGCIFCSAGGSGDFASSATLSITDQIEEAKGKVSRKIKDGLYIAYFQAYTNTYGPIKYLRRIFFEAISHKDIVAISIATRPDCLGDDVLNLLDELNKIKPVFVELGLQTTNEKTASYINRGYDLDCFEAAVIRLHNIGINVVVHVIIGLPGETSKDVFNTINHISSLPINGIKLQLLHVLKNTKLAKDYADNKFKTLKMDDYIKIVAHCIELLPTDIVIHRITGDGPKNLLIAPLWSLNKKHVLNSLNKYFRDNDITQGSKIT